MPFTLVEALDGFYCDYVQQPVTASWHRRGEREQDYNPSNSEESRAIVTLDLISVEHGSKSTTAKNR